MLLGLPRNPVKNSLRELLHRLSHSDYELVQLDQDHFHVSLLSQLVHLRHHGDIEQNPDLSRPTVPIALKQPCIIDQIQNLFIRDRPRLSNLDFLTFSRLAWLSSLKTSYRSASDTCYFV